MRNTTRNRNNPEGFGDDKFIDEIKDDGRVDFHFSGKKRGMFNDIRVEAVAEPDERQVSLPKHCLHTGPDSWRGENGRNVHVIDVIGDRWTALVQASTYYGLHRFADIQAALRRYGVDYDHGLAQVRA